MCCAVAYAVGLPDFVFYALVALSIAVYAVILNFFRCPKRRFQGDTADVVVAPADGKVVVNEEVEENEYFGDRRRMVAIFMSLVTYMPTGSRLTGMLRVWSTRTAISIWHGFRKPVWRTNIPL